MKYNTELKILGTLEHNIYDLFTLHSYEISGRDFVDL
jgi:hypothetical protein